MFNTETDQDRLLRSELRKAENREKVAQCKLDRLKVRFDGLYDTVATCEEELQRSRAESQRLRDELEVARMQRDRASEESLMWRTQLFERMELLEESNQQLKAAEQELEEAWLRAGRATETHQTSHQELQKRDQERLAFELKIQELQRAERAAKDKTVDLLGAVTDAETAIQELQRSNDHYQREVDSLKSLGARLSEKLSKATKQSESYKETYVQTLDELKLERTQNEMLSAELSRLTDELYEVKGRLVTLQIESDVREIRKTGSEKAERPKADKFARFPSSESPAVREGKAIAWKPAGSSLLSKAGKRMSGWFKIQDESES